MPQVPYQPYATETPISGTGARGISVSTPIEAFGGAVAQATEHLGKVAAQAGDTLFHRAEAMQDLRNQTEANDIAVEAEIAVGKKFNEFKSLEGKNAVAAQDGFYQDLKETQKTYAQQGSNPAVKRMVDQSTKHMIARTIFAGASHAANEQKTWTKQSLADSIALNNKTIGDNPMDEATVARKKAENERLVDSFIAIHGLDPETSGKKMKLELGSKATKEQIEAMLSANFPGAAQDTLEKATKAGLLTREDQRALEQVVTTQVRSIEGANIANAVTQSARPQYDPISGTDTKAMSLEDQEAEGRKQARGLRPNDPILEQHVVTNIRNNYLIAENAKTMETRKNRSIVWEGILNPAVKDMQTLNASNPEVAAAVKKLPPEMQSDVPKWIEENLRSRDGAEQRANFTRLAGMATDPDRLLGSGKSQIEEFLDTNLYETKLRPEDRIALMKIRNKLMVDPSGDPRVRRYMKVAEDAYSKEMKSLGIVNEKTPTAHKDNYNTFRGMLQSALEGWAEDHKKAATYKDVKETIVPMLLREISKGPGFFSLEIFPDTPLGRVFTPGVYGQEAKEPLYRVDPKWRIKFIDSEKAATGVVPTEPEIRKAYFRQTYQELYGTK